MVATLVVLSAVASEAMGEGTEVAVPRVAVSRVAVPRAAVALEAVTEAVGEAAARPVGPQAGMRAGASVAEATAEAVVARVTAVEVTAAAEAARAAAATAAAEVGREKAPAEEAVRVAGWTLRRSRHRRWLSSHNCPHPRTCNHKWRRCKCRLRVCLRLVRNWWRRAGCIRPHEPRSQPRWWLCCRD